MNHENQDNLKSARKGLLSFEVVFRAISLPSGENYPEYHEDDIFLEQVQSEVVDRY